MEIELLALCVKIVKNATESPLGEAIENYISERNLPQNFLEKINEIILKLKQNQFSKIEDFLSEYNEAINEFTVLNDNTSDICVAVLAIQQQINEGLNQLILQEKSEFINKTKDFVVSIKNFLPNIPNDENSYHKLVQSVNERQLSETFLENLSSARLETGEVIPEIHMDGGEILQLKQKIQCIDNDENLQKIGQIVRLNEDNVTISPSGNIEFDLFKCNKYTIKLIRDMIAHASIKVPPIPPSSPMNL